MLIILGCLSLVTFLGIYFLQWMEKESVRSEKNEIRKEVREIIAGHNAKDSETKKRTVSKDIVRYLQNYYQNEDIVGFLVSENFVMEEAVVYTGENDFYDRRDLHREYYLPGTIMLWSRNRSINDPFITLFGHNMEDGEKFGKLNESKYYKELEKIDLYTLQGKNSYCLDYILKIHVSDYNDIDTSQWDGVKEVLSSSCETYYSSGRDLPEGDNYMLLSTCSVYQTPYRVVAIYREEDRLMKDQKEKSYEK